MLDKAFKLFQRKKKTHRKKREGRNVLYSIEFIKLEQMKKKKTKTKSTIQNYYSVSKLKNFYHVMKIFSQKNT